MELILHILTQYVQWNQHLHLHTLPNIHKGAAVSTYPHFVSKAAWDHICQFIISFLFCFSSIGQDICATCASPI